MCIYFILNRFKSTEAFFLGPCRSNLQLIKLEFGAQCWERSRHILGMSCVSLLFLHFTIHNVEFAPLVERALLKQNQKQNLNKPHAAGSIKIEFPAKRWHSVRRNNLVQQNIEHFREGERNFHMGRNPMTTLWLFREPRRIDAPLSLTSSTWERVSFMTAGLYSVFPYDLICMLSIQLNGLRIKIWTVTRPETRLPSNVSWQLN